MTPADALTQWRRRLYLPAYSIVDAARYAGTRPQTVSYWFYGGGGLGPALPGKERGRLLSYLQLVEVAFVASFRTLGVSLQRIRRAREYLAQALTSEYPFAQYRLKTEGHHVLLDLNVIEPDAELGRLVTADEGGQIAWADVIAERFAEFHYEEQLAVCWFVGGIETGVVIDPRIQFGAPTVAGVPTWVIKGRWIANESLDEIQEDFGLSKEDILKALAFEGLKVAA